MLARALHLLHVQVPLPSPPKHAPKAFVLGGDKDCVVDVEAVQVRRAHARASIPWPHMCLHPRHPRGLPDVVLHAAACFAEGRRRARSS